MHRQVANSLLTRTTIGVHAHLPKQVAQNFKLSRCAAFRVACKPKPIEPLPKFWGQFLQHFLVASFEMSDVSHRTETCSQNCDQCLRIGAPREFGMEANVSDAMREMRRQANIKTSRQGDKQTSRQAGLGTSGTAMPTGYSSQPGGPQGAGR